VSYELILNNTEYRTKWFRSLLDVLLSQWELKQTLSICQ